MNFPVVSFVVDWKLLLLLDCDELCTTFMHHFYAPLLSMSRLCSKLLSWLLWLKYDVFFFLIVGNCDEHMHHVDLSDKNYLSDCF